MRFGAIARSSAWGASSDVVGCAMDATGWMMSAGGAIVAETTEANRSCPCRWMLGRLLNECRAATLVSRRPFRTFPGSISRLRSNRR